MALVGCGSGPAQPQPEHMQLSHVETKRTPGIRSRTGIRAVRVAGPGETLTKPGQHDAGAGGFWPNAGCSLRISI